MKTKAKRVYSPRTIKRARRSKTEMDRIRQAIHTTLAAYNPMTVRQCFYQLTTQGVIGKTEAEYKTTVIRLLVEMRLAGDIPFDWIADNTRWMRKPRTFSSMEAALQNCASTYRRALWDNQDVYVEVWTEKDAIAIVRIEARSLE